MSEQDPHKPVAQGEFQLDHRKAREKLQRFQLVDPHYYVLEFVKAAHLLDATEISFSITAAHVEVTFDGSPLSQQELSGLFSAAFRERESRREKALRHLAIGVNSAQGLDLKNFSIRVGGASPCEVMLFEDRIEALSPPFEDSPGTVICLKHRSRGILRLFSSLVDLLPETKALRTRALYSDIPVLINGHQISIGHSLPESFGKPVVIDKNGVRGVIAASWTPARISHPGPREPTKPGEPDQLRRFTTHIIQNGVVLSVAARPSPFTGFSLEAIVDCPQLQTNLSQSEVVEDDAWQRVESRLYNSALLSLVLSFQEMPFDQLARRRGFIQTVLIDAFATLDRDALDAETIEKLVDATQELPLFTDALPDTNKSIICISIADGRITNDGRSLLRFATSAHDRDLAPSFEAPVLLIPVENSRQLPASFLQYFADDVEDLSERLHRTESHLRNKEQWQSSPYKRRDLETISEVGRHSKGCLVRVSLLENQPVTRLLYVKDRRLLREDQFPTHRRESNLNPGPFEIEISGDFEANEFFDGPAPTSRIHQIQVEVARIILQIVLESHEPRRILQFLVLGTLTGLVKELFGWEELPEELQDTPLKIPQDFEDSAISNTLKILFGQPIYRRLDGEDFSINDLRRALADDPEKGRLWLARVGQREVELPPNIAKFVFPTVEPDQEVLSRLFPDDVLALTRKNIEIYILSQTRIIECEPFTIAVEDSAPKTGEEETDGESAGPPEIPRTADQKMIAGLDNLLRRHATGGIYESFEDLASIEIVEASDRQAARLRSGWSRLTLNKKHPAIAAALESPDDPVAVAFVALAVITVLDRFRRLEDSRRIEPYGKSEFLARLNPLSAPAPCSAPDRRQRTS